MPKEAVATWLRNPPWQVLLLPSSWSASWGLLFENPIAWIGVLAGVSFTLLAGGAVVRWVLPDSRGESIQPVAMRSSHLPWVRIVELALWPFTRGREGWFVRRLTAAHVRDDPFTLGGLMAGSLVALGYLAFYLTQPEIMESLPRPGGGIPTRSSFPFLLGALTLPLIVIPTMIYSSDARAIWVLAAANLDPRRVVRAQRGVARGVSLFPSAAVLLLVHGRAGSSLFVAVADVVLIWLVWELITGTVQLLYPVLPFSRPREGRGEELFPFFLLIMPAFVLLAVWIAAVYDLLPFASGKLLTVAALGAGIWRLHRKIDAGIAERGLPVELAPPVKAVRP
jgi:hypothetical protein